MRFGYRFSVRFNQAGDRRYQATVRGHRYFLDPAERPLNRRIEYCCEVVNRFDANTWRVRLLDVPRESIEAWAVYSTSFGDVVSPPSRFTGKDVPASYLAFLELSPWLFPAVFHETDNDGPFFSAWGVPFRPVVTATWGRLFDLGKRFLVSPRTVGVRGIWCELVSPMVGNVSTPQQLAAESFKLKFDTLGRYGLQGSHQGRILCPAPGWIPFPNLGETREVCSLRSPVELPTVGFVVPQSAYFATDAS